MIIKKVYMFFAACILLSCCLSGCVTATHDYNRFNTEHIVPKEKIALLACDPLYADINNPWISLFSFSTRTINGQDTIIPGKKGLGIPATGWKGIIELMPGRYEICASLKYTTYGAEGTYSSNECVTVIFRAEAGHTYLLSPHIDIVAHTWKPILKDISNDTSSVKQWIDEHVAAASGTTPSAAKQDSHPIITNSSAEIKVSNLSNPGQRPRPGDRLLATQTLEDGSVFELEFNFDPMQRHKRVYGKGLSFSEYLIFYSKDGQMVESIYEIIVGADTDKGRVNGLQKVGSDVLLAIDYSAPLQDADQYRKGKDGNYKYMDLKDYNGPIQIH